jgi:hypothetical protein
MAEPIIDYETLAQNALRGVVREALRAAPGPDRLPGEHHFYITFKSQAPGVKLADYIVQKYPDEITIVIEHQFFDLEVHDDWFEVVLKFGGVPQHIVVPFAAVVRFYDPSVKFALQFRYDEPTAAAAAPAIAPAAEPPEPSNGVDGAAQVVSLDAFRRKT